MNKFERMPTHESNLDLEKLLHPAQAFNHPRDVVADPDLTLNEKRAVLASWASDACAVEAAPALRCAPGATSPVSVDEILQALCALDQQAKSLRVDPARYQRQLRRRAIEARRSRTTGRPGEDAHGLSH